MTAQQPDTNPRHFIIDRTFISSVERVWKMWTTKEGLEKWWGPEGFSSVVTHLDVRVGGRFEIAMTALLPQIIAHLKASGMGASSSAKGDYTQVDTNCRLVYTNAVDFVPGMRPYITTTSIELSANATGGTRLIVTNDVMHDEHWTKMASMGWTQQLDKLRRLTQ